MPAAPERTVLATIPDAEDLEVRVSLITWPGRDWPAQIEIADYVLSTDTYGRGYLFDTRHMAKVIAGMRTAKAAGLEAAAKEVSA